jgi:hypothetical protein
MTNHSAATIPRYPTVLAFDVEELRKHGVAIAPLPDERGRIIDARALPRTFTETLQRHGLDTSRLVRIVGAKTEHQSGTTYLIRFEQA